MRDDGRALHHRLTPSSRQRLAHLLSIAALGGTLAPRVGLASEIELRVSLPRETAAAKVEILWDEVSRSDGSGPDRHTTFLEAPDSVVLDLEPRSIWQVSVASQRFWAAPEIVSVGDSSTVAHLELWPTTQVVGEIEVEGVAEVPSSVDLRFESPPDAGSRIARSQVTCPVKERRYECALPATRLDLRLRAQGFISHYFWDLELHPDRPYSLPSSNLRHGASIVGWVEMEDADASFEAARVTLSRQIASATMDPTSDQRRAALDLETTVNPRGFFELVDVPQGLYAVTVEHPAFAPGRYAPVQVLENAEAELYPIQLRKAATLQLEIRPSRPATRKRWSVELLRQGEAPGHLDLAADGLASEQGAWSRAGLAPGGYVLRITDGPEAAWYRDELQLAESGTHVQRVDLPAETVAGNVLLGSDPIEAELYFVAYHGAVRIPARSDSEGRFEIDVPLRDSWTVDVFAREKQVSQRFQDVRPESSSEDGRRWIELVIPDTTVSGTVVDAQDRSVENARVRAGGRAGGQTQRSDSDGAFSLRGLRPGEYWLGATSNEPRSRSALHRIEVEEDKPALPVELVLNENRRIEGQVVGPSGQGVVGAQIVGKIEQSYRQPVAFEVPETITDLTGSFSLELPDLAEGVLLTAFPPGFAARQIRVDSRSPEPVFISVEPRGGTLRIRYDEPVQRHQLRIFKTWLLPAHFSLTNWAQLHGEPNSAVDVYTVPMLEPGYYQVCTDPHGNSVMTGRLEPELESRCRGGMLPPYGELVLEVRLD